MKPIFAVRETTMQGDCGTRWQSYAVNARRCHYDLDQAWLVCSIVGFRTVTVKRLQEDA